MIKAKFKVGFFSLRYIPALTLLVFLAPVLAGLVSTLLPAFGYLPVIGQHNFSGHGWNQLWEHPAVPKAIFLSLSSGFIATIASLMIAVAFVAAWQETRSFKWVRRLLAPVLAIPHSALAIGLAFLIAPSGWVVRIFSSVLNGWQTPPDIAIIHDPLGLSLILGLVIKETPFLILMILAALDQSQSRQRLNVARSLGYKPVAAWAKVVWPVIYKQIRLPVFAVLAFSLSVVDVALILGPTAPPPLSVLILRWFYDPDLQLRVLAAAGAVLQLGLVIGSVLIWFLAERVLSYGAGFWLDNGGRSFFERSLKASSKILIFSLMTLFGGSFLVILVWSITRRWRFPDALPSVWSLQSWDQNISDLLASAGTTFTVGLASSFLAICLVISCLENEKQRAKKSGSGALLLVYLPLIIPQVSFLFGVQVLALKAGIDGSWLAMIWSHLLFVLPYVFLSLSDPYRAQDDRYVRSALSLGCSPAKAFWQVRLPMLLRPLLFALAIGFSVSVAQYLPTLFAGAGRFSTLTTEAVTLSAGGNRRVIAVYALLQAALPLLIFAAAINIPNMVFRNRQMLKGS